MAIDTTLSVNNLKGETLKELRLDSQKTDEREEFHSLT